jgi:hypothetical protein
MCHKMKNISIIYTNTNCAMNMIALNGFKTNSRSLIKTDANNDMKSMIKSNIFVAVFRKFDKPSIPGIALRTLLTKFSITCSESKELILLSVFILF